MHRHGNRTFKGDDARQKHQENYERWWLGEEVDSSSSYNNIPAKGKVVKVEYIGNSVYGSVQVELENGCVILVGPAFDGGFRPKKSDLWLC